MQTVAAMSEYRQAFRSVRLAAILTMLALALAIVAQLFTFAVVRFGGVIDAASEVTLAGAPSSAPSTAPTQSAGGYEPKAVTKADSWYRTLMWLMAGVKFLAVVAAGLLALTVLVAVLLALVGGLAGVAEATSAFFWSLILLAVIIPWQQLLDSTFASGALFNLSYLVQKTHGIRSQWGAANAGILDQVLYYARFAAYPIVALLLLVVVAMKFFGGARKACSAGTISLTTPGEPTAKV